MRARWLRRIVAAVGARIDRTPIRRWLRRIVAAVGARIDRTPIRLRLALTFAGVMVVLFGVLFLLLYVRFAAGLDDGIAASLNARAGDLTAVARESNAALRADPSLPDTSGTFAQILTPQGGVLAATDGLAHRSLLSRSSLADARRRRIEVNFGERTRLRAEPMDGAQEHVLVVGVSLADRNGALAGLRRLLFIGGPILLLLACVAGYLVAAKALAPVERMRRRADWLRGGDVNGRLPVPPSRDEIQWLGETLNEMLARVEEVVARGRMFVAGASHELRTPLTILQLELDEALDGERTREELEEAMGSAREEVRRLTALAEDLLLIAQADQERLPINRQRFEVHSSLRVIAERFGHLEVLASRRLIVAPAAEIMVEADVARLDQAVSNLVHNALRFSGGPIVLRANRIAGAVEIHVLDRGPGFTREFMPHAFERFSRADPARGRGGTGLGLAIVLAIAEGHGGQVRLRNRDGGGADVWLTLPDAPRAGSDESPVESGPPWAETDAAHGVETDAAPWVETDAAPWVETDPPV